MSLPLSSLQTEKSASASTSVIGGNEGVDVGRFDRQETVIEHRMMQLLDLAPALVTSCIERTWEARINAANLASKAAATNRQSTARSATVKNKKTSSLVWSQLLLVYLSLIAPSAVLASPCTE
jgi:hypothetical protein